MPVGLDYTPVGVPVLCNLHFFSSSSAHQNLSGPDRGKHHSLHHKENIWPIRHRESQRPHQAAGQECPIRTGNDPCAHIQDTAGHVRCGWLTVCLIRWRWLLLFRKTLDAWWQQYETQEWCCRFTLLFILFSASRLCGYYRMTWRATLSKSAPWWGTESGLWNEDSGWLAQRAPPWKWVTHQHPAFIQRISDRPGSSRFLRYRFLFIVIYW